MSTVSFRNDGLVPRVAIALLACLALATAQPAMAERLRIIELDDGSRIAGEILAFESGVYTIQSDTLGRLHIPDENIRAILSDRPEPILPGESLTPMQGPSTAAQYAELQSHILNDPNLLTIVMSLQSDPQILSILNDTTVMDAIAAGNLDALQSHPKIRALEDHQTIQQLLQLMGRR
jgi:hypothetical protein